MSDIAALLLKPPPGDDALLAEECGAHPPQAVRESEGAAWIVDAECVEVESEGVIDRWPLSAVMLEHRSLVLVRGGVPVAMACDRLARWAHEKAGTAPLLNYSLLDVFNTAARVAKLTGARLIFVDANGKEIPQ